MCTGCMWIITCYSVCGTCTRFNKESYIPKHLGRQMYGHRLGQSLLTLLPTNGVSVCAAAGNHINFGVSFKIVYRMACVVLQQCALTNSPQGWSSSILFV